MFEVDAQEKTIEEGEQSSGKEVNERTKELCVDADIVPNNEGVKDTEVIIESTDLILIYFDKNTTQGIEGNNAMTDEEGRDTPIVDTKIMKIVEGSKHGEL